MRLQGYLVPVTSFVLACLLSLVAGPARKALSRQAADNSGCTPTCNLKHTKGSALSVATSRSLADFDGSGEIVDPIQAKTGNVGSVTVTSDNFMIKIGGAPVGNEGGGGGTLRGRLHIGGATVNGERIIVYGNRALPVSTTIHGALSMTARGLETCTDVKGDLNWNVHAFAVYVAPLLPHRAIGATSSADGWTCSAQ